MDAYTAEDRSESTDEIEPMLLSEKSRASHALSDLALDLAQKSAGLRRSLPQPILTALATLVRSMNCYYSNLIEGHATHPIDIERALKGDYSNEPRKRNLQHEAKAHIAVQRWIDDGGLVGKATTIEAIQSIHRLFYKDLPDDLKWIEDPITKRLLPVNPGEFRAYDVQVGRHIAISPGAVPRFLNRFEKIYSKLGKSDSVLMAAAAHHRLA